MKIAINQVGSESHLDYIKMLSPNILKVNIEKLSYESWSAQNDVFTSLGALARKIGANMLFEGIIVCINFNLLGKTVDDIIKGNI